MEEDGNSGSGSLGSWETAIDDNSGSVDREVAPNSNFSYGNGHTSCEPDIDGLGNQVSGILLHYSL